MGWRSASIEGVVVGFLHSEVPEANVVVVVVVNVAFFYLLVLVPKAWKLGSRHSEFPVLCHEMWHFPGLLLQQSAFKDFYRRDDQEYT